MFRDYEEACAARVSWAQAKAEIDQHDVDGGFELFLQEVGHKPTYLGKEVLDWLGY
jgi:hypothetical protein